MPSSKKRWTDAEDQEVQKIIDRKVSPSKANIEKIIKEDPFKENNRTVDSFKGRLRSMRKASGKETKTVTPWTSAEKAKVEAFVRTILSDSGQVRRSVSNGEIRKIIEESPFKENGRDRQAYRSMLRHMTDKESERRKQQAKEMAEEAAAIDKEAEREIDRQRNKARDKYPKKRPERQSSSGSSPGPPRKR